MYIKYERACILLLTLAFLQITNAQQKWISLKPMMQAIPTIDSSYSVVHSEIYPQENEEKFKAIVPADFYVQKAKKNRDKTKIQTVNIQQQQNIQQPLIQQKAQAGLSKKPQILAAALSANNQQKIKWAITPPNQLSKFVIDNGVQHAISQAIPLQKSTQPADMGSQDRPIDQLTPINPQETMSKGQIKPQNQLRSQKIKVPVTDVRQQRKALPNIQPSTQQPKVEQKSSNITLIIVGAIVLVCIFVFVRSQRKKKVRSLSILHSRLESYKIQQKDEDLDSFSKSKTSLQQDEGSDDQYQGESTHVYKYNDNRL